MGFLKNTKNGRVFAWTPELAKLPHMVMYDQHEEPIEPARPIESPVLPEQKKPKLTKKTKGFGGGD